MDVVTAVLQAPVNTILIIAGIVIVFFALFEISKGTVRLRTEKANIAPIIVGALLIIGGLLYKSQTTSSAESPNMGLDISIATQTPLPPLETPSATTEAQTPTVAPSDTPTPTPQIKTLADGCIAAQTWQAKSINTEALSSVSTSPDNCLNLHDLGISVEKGGKLHLLATAPKSQTASGIFMPVGNESVIEFKIFVKSLYLVYPDAPAYITFSIAPQGDPMAGGGSGRFKLQVEKNDNPPLVFFILADINEQSGSRIATQHYLYGHTYTVRMELKSIYMQIYINDAALKEDISIPSGSKVFYIGYNLPLQAGTDMEITDIKVDGITP